MPDTALPADAAAELGFDTAIAASIWDLKYRLKDGGAPVDADLGATRDRVARALAAAEAEPDTWAPRFREALEDAAFLPAGRIWAGTGTDRAVTLFNCFVMGTIPDDMGGIFDALREAALTLQQGGGIGYDFSTLRPRGAPVAGVGADASGPLSFMDVWDSMCATIMSAGNRRGAMMATLRCDHPDIEAFVDAKRDPARLRNFNLSVLATDPFMAAVEADGDWDLTFGGRVHRTVKARALWDRIMRATYDVAEPGVIFIDRINQQNNLSYAEAIAATNPCGEQPLPPYGACLLGSVNLAALVVDPYGTGATLDGARLARTVRTAVRMMDGTVDVSRFPLPAQAEEARAKRRIGLGVTGLADALMMTGLRYGTPEAGARAGEWMREIAREAYLASADLAAEKGAFPLYDAEAFGRAPILDRLGADVRAAIVRNGIRNALLTSIAPTGTISLFAGNVSSGIEPVFAPAYARKVLMPDGTREETEAIDHAVRVWRERGGEGLPPAYVDAQTLTPEEHVAMQAAVQPWVDSSISKTVNLPEDISFEAFKEVYALAHATGCKGCTTYRPNAVTGAVLSVADAPRASADAEVLAVPRGGPSPDPMPRPPALEGTTYKLVWPESAHAIYLTVNDAVLGGRRVPFEVFVNSKNMEHYAWTVALTRMISAVFRRGGDVSFVVDELKAIFDPRGGAWVKGRYVPSLLAAIGGALEEHMVAIGFLDGPAAGPGPVTGARAGPAAGGAACPRCGETALHMAEGCATCTNCGYSRCG
ncbi:MAG: adenosylcobalamin-dependent ribonucleoside-diphosphate reductase [Hasllibacter sp.]